MINNSFQINNHIIAVKYAPRMKFETHQQTFILTQPIQELVQKQTTVQITGRKYRYSESACIVTKLILFICVV